MSRIDRDLQTWIEQRATQGHVNEKIGLAIDEAPEFDYLDPSANLYEVAGTYAGAVDFEVIVTGPYEVNVADWCAEYYAKTNQETGDGEPWEITVTPYVKDDETGEYFTHMSNGDMPTYKVTDETWNA
jgi:hypothetical protein